MGKNIISKPGEKPKLKVTWWAMILGLLSVVMIPLLMLFAFVLRPILGNSGLDAFAVSLGFTAPAVAIAGLVTGIIALAKGERSWAIWVGFIPAALVSAFWIFMFVGELFFME